MFKRLTTASEVSNLIASQNDDIVVIDVETTSKNAREAKLLDIQMSKGADDVYIFDAEFAPEILRLPEKITLVAHNYKYDAHVLYRHGVDLLKRTWRDTLLMGHLANENRESYSLDSYVKEMFNDDYKEAFWSKYKSYQEASEEDKIHYACSDIIYTGRIYRHLSESLRERENIPCSLIEHVHRLAAALLQTEIHGVCIDRDYLGTLGERLLRRIQEIQPQMRSCVADEIDLIELEEWEKEIAKRKTPKGKASVQRPSFSFESSKQLQHLLYSSLSLPVQKNAKTKAISTDSASLERLKGAHPIIELIEENRELQKIYGTYIQGTLERQVEGKIYPEFRVSGTSTGRISHSNPNLAQLPKSGGVRGIYRASDGMVLLSADYSQLEVIIEANLTGDKTLKEMIENGESKHDMTARGLGVDRNTAKTLNFALQYWASHFQVQKILKCSEPEAKKVWEAYWRLYSGPKRLKAITDAAVDDGIPIVTKFGRKRRFEVRRRALWDKDYRQAYNFLIQSTGADITSRAFYEISDHLERHNRGRGLFTVHDEILLECKKEDVDSVQKLLLSFMESIGTELEFKIPLRAESSGPMERWED